MRHSSLLCTLSIVLGLYPVQSIWAQGEAQDMQVESACFAEAERDWLEFQGSAVYEDDTVLLIDWTSMSMLRMQAEDVRQQPKEEDVVIEVQRGATVIERLVTNEDGMVRVSTSCANALAAQAIFPPDLPRTYCVGFLAFCCENDTVISGCFGAWDCSAGFTNRGCPR